MHVTRNCFDALPGDERRDVFDPPPVLRALVEKKWLGSKTKQGFYKKVGDQILQLDLKTLEYVPQTKPRFPSLGAARGTDDVDERMRRILAGDDRAATLARTVLYETLIYSANRLGEIADDVVEIDRALRWGFGWQRGPFETWDALGVKETAAKMEAAGYTVPGLGARADLGPGRRHAVLPAGGPWQAGAARQARRLHAGAGRPARAVASTSCARAGGEVERNSSASILDIGDGVFCLEFHSKMNAIDPDIVSMIFKRGRARRARRRRAGGRQRRARRLLGGREPVRADGRDRPERHGRHRPDAGAVSERLPAHALRARAGGRRAVRAGAGRRRRGRARLSVGPRRDRALRRLRRGRRRPDPGRRRLHGAGGARCRQGLRRSLLRSAVAGARAVRDAGARARVDQRRGGARHGLPARRREHVDVARDAARRRQAGGAGPGARRLSPAAAAAHPRHRRVGLGDDRA